MVHRYVAVYHLANHQIPLILEGYFSGLIQKVDILGHLLSSVPFVPFAIFRPWPIYLKLSSGKTPQKALYCLISVSSRPTHTAYANNWLEKKIFQSWSNNSNKKRGAFGWTRKIKKRNPFSGCWICVKIWPAWMGSSLFLSQPPKEVSRLGRDSFILRCRGNAVLYPRCPDDRISCTLPLGASALRQQETDNIQGCH